MNNAEVYANGVLSGEIPACKFVHQSCTRFLKDIESDLYVYDEEKAQQAINQIENQRHTKGEWRGKPLLLEPWQHFIVANLFGLYRHDGRRKYTRSYLEMPKKQGKSPLAAAIGNVMLLDEDDGAPEVYSAATKLDQASIVFQYGADMFEGLNKEYGLGAKISSSSNYKRVVYNGGLFRPIAYDERDKNDGLSVSCAIIDEYHAHPSDRIYNVLADGMAARKSPLLLAITTAGHDRSSACFKHREYCVKVLDGLMVDEDLFILIYTIDEGDKWDEESTWKKANPNYGISVKPDYIVSKIAEARESGIKRDSFLIKHLNVWTDTYSVWIGSKEIQEAMQEFEPDCSAYCGLDFASSGDFSALSMNFEKDGVHRIVTKYYIPEERARNWPSGVGQQIRQWVRDGFITATPGNTTDYDYIENDLKECVNKYDVISVGYDPANAKQFASKMVTDGINMRAFTQNIMNISFPTKRTEELIMSKKLIIEPNPVTAWMFSNVQIYKDANLNIKAVKSKDPNKNIDGVISLIMSVGEAIDEENKKEWFFAPTSI